MNKIEEKFGIKPEEVGIKFMNYDVITELDIEDKIAGAKLNDLCIITADADFIDYEFDDKKNYLGTVRDTLVPMYRYYYFGELNESN